MKHFDNNIHRAIGYADIQSNGNAYIDIVGFCDESNNIVYLSEKEREEEFPPKGHIFAHNFILKYPDLNHSIVTLMCLQNAKEGEGLDKYIWDKSQSVYEFGRRIFPLKGTITDDGENNYKVFAENHLAETDREMFVYSNHRVYKIKANSSERIIRYWKDASLDITNIHGEKHLIGHISFPRYDGAIDLTTDDQLVAWYVNKVLSSNWKEILKANDFSVAEPYILDALSALKNLDDNIISSRMERLRRINMTFLFTLDELKHIAETPWFKSSIEASLAKYKETFFKDLIANHQKEIEEFNFNHQLALAEAKEKAQKDLDKVTAEVNSHIAEMRNGEDELEYKVLEKLEELEQSQEKLDEKQKELDNLQGLLDRAEEQKSHLVEDFSVIKDVLGILPPPSIIPVKEEITENQSEKTFHTTYLNLAETPAPMYQAFKRCVNDTFRKNGIPTTTSSTVSEQFAAYNILLVPDAAIAKGLVMAAKRCHYLLEYVSALWKSFDDLWMNGLESILKESIKNPDELYILILQNINITYLPHYMQPLIDIESGIVDTFPFVNYEFPDNLRIICTVTEDDVMPLSKQCLKYMGCIDKTPFKKDFYGRICYPDDSNIGYLSPKLLSSARKNLTNVANFYKQYLNEE